MANPLTREDLLSLESYAAGRDEFRARAVVAKRARMLRLGDHLTLFFENRLTIQYQVQEMLRIERIFEAAGIQEELDAYNPLIPDGANWKATCMIEYQDEQVRREQLQRLRGIEDRIWVRVGNAEKIFAIADEDLERANEDKTSAVHFLRFALGDDDCEAVRQGQPISVGVDHPHYESAADPVPEALRKELSGDIEPR
ncbi:MAG: DUF3501 family protein [Xanthomonadales bacterium]|nr:DUF3501 family protein [Xanthomonadales bacterium]